MLSATTLSGSPGVSRGRLNSTNGPLDENVDLTAPMRLPGIINGGQDRNDGQGPYASLLYGDEARDEVAIAGAVDMNDAHEGVPDGHGNNDHSDAMDLADSPEDGHLE